PHTEAAQRLLSGAGEAVEARHLPDPARCFLAIRHARLALAQKPDDSLAYRILSAAYRDLMFQEAAMLAGISLDDRAAMAQMVPRPQQLMNRFRQRVTSLNFAIQTTPPPRSAGERNVVWALNLELYQLYRSVNFFDLARDRLRAALAVASAETPMEARSQLSPDLAARDDQTRQRQDGPDGLSTAQQASPAQRAEFALKQGAPGFAIQELEEALQTNVNPAAVKPQLIDLYCDTGQPEKALELLGTSSSIDDATLGFDPGVPALRQARVYLLLGNYEFAATLLGKHSVPQIRHERSFKAQGASLGLIHGELKSATSTFLSLPGKLSTQAVWENELGFCRLEAGQPTQAAKDLEHSLVLVPSLPNRLVTA